MNIFYEKTIVLNESSDKYFKQVKELGFNKFDVLKKSNNTFELEKKGKHESFYMRCVEKDKKGKKTISVYMERINILIELYDGLVKAISLIGIPICSLAFILNLKPSVHLLVLIAFVALIFSVTVYSQSTKIATVLGYAFKEDDNNDVYQFVEQIESLESL